MSNVTLAVAQKAARVSPRLRAYLALAAGIICISFTAIFTRWAGMPGPVAAAWRMALAAAILLLPVARHLRTSSPVTRTTLRRAAPWGLMGGVWFAANLALFNSAVMLTSVANAALLGNTAPVWVGLGALVIFKERLTGRYVLGLVLALVGAAIVTGLTIAGFTLRSGDVLAFVGAVFYAGYLLNTQRARRDLDSLSYIWLVAVTAALVLLFVSLALRLPLTGYPPRSYAAVVALALLSQIGGWLLIGYALGHLPASSVVVVLLAQPVITGLISIPLLGEALTLRQLVGGALALAGIYLCLRRETHVQP